MRWTTGGIALCLALAAGCDSKETTTPAPQQSAEKKAEQKAAPDKQAEQPAAAPTEVDQALLAAFAPLPEVMASPSNPITEEKVALGRMLYYDHRFSVAQGLSCNSCHLLDQYGVDNQPTSEGHKKQRGDRNAPSVYNAAGHIAQFWDGRSPDVEDQAKGPVTNPVEMAMPSPDLVLEVLRSMPGYVAAFEKAFPGEADPVTFDNFGKAIGAFERKLVTPSRWDAFLKGDQGALTPEEKQGFNTFAQSGCITCHSGAYLGGHMYQKVGLVKPWPDLKDEGRAKATGNEADKYFFKVPSLRNVAKTGPYFHDGSVADLGTAVKMMAEYQLGRQLTDEQVKSIVTFLGALTGELPKEYIAKPELPEATDKTPKPTLD